MTFKEQEQLRIQEQQRTKSSMEFNRQQSETVSASIHGSTQSNSAQICKICPHCGTQHAGMFHMQKRDLSG